jgi:hypothetical protein
MSFKTWREADEVLAAATGPATPKQQALGKQANTEIPPDMPKLVAAAKLRLALAEELNLALSHSISDRYDERLEALVRASDLFVQPLTEEEAYSWVVHLRFVRRRECISALKLNEGDIVETTDGEMAEVSSIGQDGRVFFKGGRGFGAWPDLISVVARSDESSDAAIEARRHAENSAARRVSASDWSMAKRHDLSEFITQTVISEDDIAELEAVITGAEDERPIQKFLEKNGHLLTALLGRDERYCIPQKRLGAEYVPDFIIGDVDSLGIRWVLVELETPRSGIYLKDGLQLDEKARKGVAQVVDWRNWLTPNIAYARRRRSEDGLGLFDIREGSEGIVLVGRRSQIPKTKDAQRQEYRQRNSIQIHTYDWLLETLRGIRQYYGPPATNPYMIPRIQPDSLWFPSENVPELPARRRS